MKSAVLHGAKDIRIEDLPIPEVLPGMVLLKVKRAGICGSDLHYFKDGYCGIFVPSRPFILGHELTAEVVSVNKSSSYSYPEIGARVTVNPARACGYCDFCKSGEQNLCKSTIMLGSGSTVPPTNGAFAEYITVRADQCHVLPKELSDAEGALIEPLAVALQAIKQAGSVSGKKVLVTGGGTIGLLTAVVAKAFGAIYVAVSDITPERRAKAIEIGADNALNPLDKEIVSKVNAATGNGFDMIFEASGAKEAVRQSFDLIKSGGTIVQIGTLGTDEVAIPVNQLMVKQINFIGSFRYANIFDEAINLVAKKRVNLDAFLTGEFQIADSQNAMIAAGDKTDSLKVQIVI
jgi:L-idonate 5-dehydrogenase